MKVDPAHFIVRRDEYLQLRGYPEACAELAGRLASRPPATFPEAFDQVTLAIAGSPVLNRDEIAEGLSGFGRQRQRVMKTSLINRKYAADAYEVRRSFGDRDRVMLTQNNPRLGRTIELSTIKNAYEVSIEHPPIGDDANFRDEHRWGAICQAYDSALDRGRTKAEREHATKECYALISHDCPHIRGSSTFAQIILQFLAHDVGFEVPLVKVDTDLNTKASMRTVEDFIKGWERGDYFDPKVTSEEVMGWHRRRAVSLPETPKL